MFEEAVKQLEEIVERLEKGDATLEESLDMFEKGIQLSKKCSEMLDKAEKRVSVLINGEKQDFIADEE